MLLLIHSLFQFRFDYDTGQLFDLCDTAEKVVKEDHTLVEFGFQYTQEKDSTPKIPGEAEKIVVVGDIHGQFHDLHRMFAMFRKPELEKDGMWLGALTHKFMFLGDYVDRGHNSLECIVLLLALKCRFPNSYYLLRGNHESRAVNLDYGFQRELIDRFDDTVGRQLWEKFNDVFDYLPLAGLIAKKILCMHGGISSCLKHLSDIKGIIRPIKDPLLEPLAKDLLWADPSPAVDNYGSNNLRGADIEVFGKKAVTQTCDNLQLMLIIRAHQVVVNLLLVFNSSLGCPQRISLLYSPAGNHLHGPALRGQRQQRSRGRDHQGWQGLLRSALRVEIQQDEEHPGQRLHEDRKPNEYELRQRITINSSFIFYFTLVLSLYPLLASSQRRSAEQPCLPASIGLHCLIIRTV